MDGLSFILQAWSSDAATSNIGTIHLRRPLVGGEGGFIDFKMFWGSFFSIRRHKRKNKL